jgi:D-amino-acid oxidase
MERIDVAVIGGGVSGLAAARAISATGRSTCVLERHPRPGLDTSTRNSGVIHAGIYYPAGSLKARLCVEGRQALYEFCAAHGVPHAKTGKLIVANDARELSSLEALLLRGSANGVEGLRMVEADFVARREPHVHAIGALYSPETGIVDAEALVKTLLRTGESSGVIFLPGTKLLGASTSNGGVELRTERETIVASQVVNAAGLYADEGRGVAAARRRGVHDLSVPRRIRGVHSREALTRELAGVSATAPLRTRAWRALVEDRRRERLAGADRQVSGPQGRLRQRPASG